MEKLFSAKVVGVNNYILSVALFAAIGGFIILLLVMITPIDGQYIGYLFIGIILITAIAALFSKQGLSTENLNEEFFVYEDHVEIEKLIFPFNEVSNLEFLFNSFSRMQSYIYQPDLEANNKKHVETGLNNFISFRYKGQSYQYSFWVESQQHFYLFVQMLEQLYTNRINFLEKNWYGKTFLMQNVTEDRYQELKQAYA